MPNTAIYKDWLFVPIPRDADSIELHDEESPAFITYHTGMGTEDYDILRDTLPSGSWQIIGKGDAIDWEGIIAPAEITDPRGHQVTAKESSYSVIRSLEMEPGTTLVLKKNEK